MQERTYTRCAELNQRLKTYVHCLISKCGEKHFCNKNQMINHVSLNDITPCHTEFVLCNKNDKHLSI